MTPLTAALVSYAVTVLIATVVTYRFLWNRVAADIRAGKTEGVDPELFERPAVKLFGMLTIGCISLAIASAWPSLALAFVIMRVAIVVFHALNHPGL